MRIAEVSIRRPVFAAVMIAVLVVFGLFAYPRIGIDLFPSVDFPVVTATVVYPGADPNTMETKVADPLEEAVQSLSGVKRLNSRNFEGVTQVIVEFQLEVEGDRALQDVRDKISAAEGQLPTGVDKPVVQKFDTGSVPVISVALAAELPPQELTRIAEKTVKTKLQQVQGVGGIEVLGARERQIKIQVHPARLGGYGLTVTDLTRALQAQSLELPAGFSKQGTRELTVTTRGEVRTPEEIAELVVSAGGIPIRVRDVATVIDGVEEARTASYLNGTSAVALVVRKQSGANTVAVAHELHEQLEELRPRLEEKGVRMAVPSDNAVFIEHSIDAVQDDLLLGAFLTVVIILVFLHDWRATLISALAIPTSVIGTFAFMDFLGFTFNNMTMLALSLSIGILVDDAIVVIENVHRHLEMGKPPLKAAYEGTAEIGFPVIATTLSIAAVFVPVAFMEGLVGRFFLQFGLVVAISVILSMFVSFTLTPMLSSRMLKAEHGRKGPLARGFDRFFGGVENFYAAVARIAIRRPIITIVLALATLVASFALVTKVPAEFIPPEDHAEFAVKVELPVGTSLETTGEVANEVAADLKESLPYVRDAFVTLGSGGSSQVNRATVTVTLTPSTTRPFSQHQAMAWVRERVSDVKGASVTVEAIDALAGDGGFRTQPVQFSIRGSNMDELIEASEALKAKLADVEGFVDLDTTYRGGKPELAVYVDREKAADLGVPVAAIAQTLRTLVSADAVSTLKDGTEVYDVVVQLSPEDRARIEDLTHLKVRSNTGRLVDLSNVVRIEKGEGASEIERMGRLRQIVLLADLDGLPLGDATAIVEQEAAKVVPEHLESGWLGSADMMIDSFIAMLRALGLAIVLVYLILAAQFDSLTQPLYIMVSLPFSVIGAFGGLYVTGMTLNLFSFIGIIMLMGLVTKAAILLVDFVNAERRRGIDLEEALVEAGKVRLRPIVMTAAATIFGMVPIALALSEGGETRAPMAVCVIGGMLSSTLLTLLVLPAIYLVGDRVGRFFGRLVGRSEVAAVAAPVDPDLHDTVDEG